MSLDQTMQSEDRIVPNSQGSKLSRLIRRDTICDTLEHLAKAQRELDDEMRIFWDAKLPRP